MKKKDIILIAGVVLIMVIALFAVGGTEAKMVDGPVALSGDEVGSIKISYSDYASKIENDENFIIVIERTGCGYCEMYMPIVDEVANELTIPVYYIDTADLTSDELVELENSNNYLRREQWGTPTTLIMSGSSVLADIGGYVEKDTFVDFIEENVILEEETTNQE